MILMVAYFTRDFMPRSFAAPEGAIWDILRGKITKKKKRERFAQYILQNCVIERERESGCPTMLPGKGKQNDVRNELILFKLLLKRQSQTPNQN